MPAPFPLTVTTPLGPNFFVVKALSAREGVSELFDFQLDLLAENGKEVAFDRLLGEKICVTLEAPGSKKRHFHGLCQRVSQGESDVTKTTYRLELVPQFWLLTRRAQSRIFQHMTIPDILKKVLTGLDVSYEIQGSYQPRDYCVQYRETDFQFASRLMEEEGIFYYFKHSAEGHRLVVADAPKSWTDLDPAKVIYETYTGGNRPDNRLWHWERVQELRSGKVALWDHCFELTGSSPGTFNHLDCEKIVPDSVQVGAVTHKLKVAGNDRLELYDYPGYYASRFDGVDRGGGDQPAEVQKIFSDNKRTVEIRMQQETTPGILIRGGGNCGLFTPGYRFTLATNADDKRAKLLRAEGGYVLTSVTHSARQTDQGHLVEYVNSFACIPQALPFRPTRITPKPFVQGTQTAVVVGPKGEEIFTDKYGRVKVQFHWDRQGKNDADSSCWVRVGTPWAGKQWGMIHIPRIGQEVIVAFQEGDPDQPIIVGSVYNAEQMPPFKLPDNKTQSGMRSRSTLKGADTEFNELRFEDKKGSEDVYFHAEKDFHRVVENNDDLKVGSSDSKHCPEGSQTVSIWKDRTTTIETGNEALTVKKGNRTTTLDQGNDTHQLKKGNREVKIDMGNDTLTISMGNQTTKLNLGASSTEAMQSITLKVGQNSIVIDQTGVTIKGLMIKVEGQIMTDVKGLMTTINGSAMVKVGGGIVMIG